MVAELPSWRLARRRRWLRRALEEHLAETQVQIERLRLLLEQLNEPPWSVPSGAMAALIDDGRRRLDETERGETLDAALIAAAQRIEHHEIASYGTARAAMPTPSATMTRSGILQQTLDEEGHTDHVLTRPRGARHQPGRRRRPARGVHALSVAPALCRRQGFPGSARPRCAPAQPRRRPPPARSTVSSWTADRAGRSITSSIRAAGLSVAATSCRSRQIEADEGGTLRTSLTRPELAAIPRVQPERVHGDGRWRCATVRAGGSIASLRQTPSRTTDVPVCENHPVYRTPTWLMTGVWMSDASGFAVRPSRAGVGPGAGAFRRTTSTGDRRAYERTAAPEPSPEPRTPDPGSRIPAPESELMIARGDSEERDPDTESGAPRIERYRER